MFPFAINHSVTEPYLDYQEGIERSLETGKPIFLLFTGKLCKNNQELGRLLDSEKVKEQLKNFVQVHLYVDDSRKLDHPYKVVRDGQEFLIQTFGDKWAHLEITKYESSRQPLIFVIDSNEAIVAGPKTYAEVSMGLDLFLFESELIYRTKK